MTLKYQTDLYSLLSIVEMIAIENKYQGLLDDATAFWGQDYVPVDTMPYLYERTLRWSTGEDSPLMFDLCFTLLAKAIGMDVPDKLKLQRVADELPEATRRIVHYYIVVSDLEGVAQIVEALIISAKESDVADNQVHD